MQVWRQHVLDILRRTGFAQVVEEVSPLLPDPVDIDEAGRILAPHGITRDVLTSQMGGSP
jgi:hypothetical protein